MSFGATWHDTRLKMSVHSRTMLPPGASKKRRDVEPLHPLKPSASKAGESLPSNRLLAGYLAFEFLSRGTLFGEKYEYDPSRSEATEPLAYSQSQPGLSKRMKPEAAPSINQSYAEVASLLKTDGAHLPGIINPTQLGRWIKM